MKNACYDKAMHRFKKHFCTKTNLQFYFPLMFLSLLVCSVSGEDSRSNRQNEIMTMNMIWLLKALLPFQREFDT